MYVCVRLVVPFLCSSEKLILGCCGFHGDVLTVTKNVTAQMKASVDVTYDLYYI